MKHRLLFVFLLFFGCVHVKEAFSKVAVANATRQLTIRASVAYSHASNTNDKPIAPGNVWSDSNVTMGTAQVSIDINIDGQWYVGLDHAAVPLKSLLVVRVGQLAGQKQAEEGPNSDDSIHILCRNKITVDLLTSHDDMDGVRNSFNAANGIANFVAYGEGFLKSLNRAGFKPDSGRTPLLSNLPLVCFSPVNAGTKPVAARCTGFGFMVDNKSDLDLAVFVRGKNSKGTTYAWGSLPVPNASKFSQVYTIANDWNGTAVDQIVLCAKRTNDTKWYVLAASSRSPTVWVELKVPGNYWNLPLSGYIDNWFAGRLAGGSKPLALNALKVVVTNASNNQIKVETLERDVQGDFESIGAIGEVTIKLQ